MLPVIVLIGRSNVGKSSLFNCLTCTKNALVANFSGFTRDRKYGYGKWKKQEFTIIDTPGIDNNEIGLEKQIIEQTLIAVKEANVILLIVDGRAGLMAADKDVVKYLLRNYCKKIIIVVNKIDGIDINIAMSDFYNLGIDIVIPVSSSHKIGIDNLIKQTLLLYNNNLLDNFFEKNKNFSKLQYKNIESFECNKQNLLQFTSSIKVAIIGSPNVGKSTLINCIIKEKRMLVCDIPGTTRDSIYIPKILGNQRYILIDTAGVRKYRKIKNIAEKISISKTLEVIKNSDVILLVIDAYIGITEQDLSLINIIFNNNGRSLVIAINKWDSISNKVRIETQEKLKQRLNFIGFIRVHYISALYNDGVINIFKSINEAYYFSIKKISTSFLIKTMRMAIDKHPPNLVQGRRIKLKYAHIGKYNPIIIVIHGTQVKNISKSYIHYLINYFRRSLKIIGTPIYIKFNEIKSSFYFKNKIVNLS